MQRDETGDLTAFLAVGQTRSSTRATVGLGALQCAPSRTAAGLEALGDHDRHPHAAETVDRRQCNLRIQHHRGRSPRDRDLELRSRRTRAGQHTSPSSR